MFLQKKTLVKLNFASLKVNQLRRNINQNAKFELGEKQVICSQNIKASLT